MRRLRMSLAVLVLAAGAVSVAAPAAAERGFVAAPATPEPTATSGAPGSRAADTAPPTLGDITVSPDTVRVAGLALVPVTVAVPLRDESGVEVVSDEVGELSPSVYLKQVSGGDETTNAELALTSGTAQDGVWSATIQVPSTWDGRWEVSRVIASDGQGNRLDVDPRDPGPAVTLEVTGTHRPAVSMRFVPDPVVGDAPLTVEGRFYFEDTDEGIGNQPIYFGYDNQCLEHRSVPNGSTATDGSFSRSYPAGSTLLHCVGIPRPTNSSVLGAYIVVASGHPRVRPAVTATASRTDVSVGTRITVTGTVTPPGTTPVQLQESRNATWRTIGTGQLDDRGRFSFDLRPQRAGTHRYRVVVPNSEDEELTGVSRTVVVTVRAPGGGGDDETLPITGPAGPPLLTGAMLLIVTGAVLVLAGRWRRSTPSPAGPAPGSTRGRARPR